MPAQLDFVAMRDKALAKLTVAQAALEACEADIKACEAKGFIATARQLRVARKRLEANFIAAKLVADELGRVK